MTKRIFVAINISRELVANLECELSRIRTEIDDKGIKWVRPENIHFTLAFLGEISEVKVRDLSKSLEKIGRQFKPFMIKMIGIGVFPDLKRPRILWIGAESAELKRLAEATQKELRSVGFKIDEKPFKSHLTIARLRQGFGGQARIRFPDRDFQEKPSGLIGKYQNQEFGKLEVKSIEIMESVLSPSGPVYQSLAKIPLAS